MCGVHLGRMKCPRCNSRGEGGETSKWQWVNWKLVSFQSGSRIHKLNFEIISKWPFSLVHTIWNVGLLTSRSSKRYIVCIKWTLESTLNLSSKSEYILPSDFWGLNFYTTESCFMPHFLCFLAFFLTPLWSFLIFQTHDILFLPFLMVHDSWLTYFLI